MDNQRIKPASEYDVFGRPIKSQPVKPVTPVVRPVVSKPVVEQPKTNPTIAKEPAVEPVRQPAKKPISKMVWYIVGGVIATVIIAVVTVIILKSVHDGRKDVPVFSDENISEEEKITTEKTVEEYVDLSVEGYQHINDEVGEFDAVVVKVTNKGEEKTSLAIMLVALDNDNNVLDKSSLYSEGIEPGQTYTFYNFVYSELAPEQLKSAKYEIYKAYTYDIDQTPADPEENLEETLEEPAEELIETSEE